jgi:hypothetical protein
MPVTWSRYGQEPTLALTRFQRLHDTGTVFVSIWPPLANVTVTS